MNVVYSKLHIKPAKCVALYAKSKRTLSEWHDVLVHVNNHEIERMATQGMVDGMIIDNPKQIKEPCIDCPQGKAIHASHPSSSRERAKRSHTL